MRWGTMKDPETGEVIDLDQLMAEADAYEAEARRRAEAEDMLSRLLALLEERCPACRGDGCPACGDLGRRPTPEGRALLEFIARHLPREGGSP